MIEIFDNRIEITNPGKPLIDPSRFVDHSPDVGLFFRLSSMTFR